MVQHVWIIAISVFIPKVISNGVPIVVSPGLNYTNPSHEPVVCTDLNTGITSNCYATLNETSYLTNWNTSLSSEICSPLEFWSTCYLNFAYTNGTTTQVTSQNVSQHDCSSLNGNSSMNGCPPPSINAKVWTPQEYYAVFNIYTVQHHIFVWSQAISAPSSLGGITLALQPNGTDTATSLLETIILGYGINFYADQALYDLINVPSIRAQPLAVSGGIGGGRAVMTAEQWVPLLVQRLQDALLLVMRDFDQFLNMVMGGAYSTNNLALAGELENSLKSP